MKRPISPESMAPVDDSAGEEASEQLKWETGLAKQRSILDAIGENKDELRPWVVASSRPPPPPKYPFGEEGYSARPAASPHDPPGNLFGRTKSPIKFAKPAVPLERGANVAEARPKDEGKSKTSAKSSEVEERVTFQSTQDHHQKSGHRMLGSSRYRFREEEPGKRDL